MRIESLKLTRLEIPFKISFSHSSATRSASQAIWVEARSNTGLVGYGEGCPREYVTGESMATAEAFFQKLHDELLAAIIDLASLKDWAKSHASDIDENPAAWCAIELALIDLMACDAQMGVEEFLGLQPLLPKFQYTAVLGDSDAETFSATLKKYLALGLSDFKVKLSGNLEKDQTKSSLLRDNLGNQHRLRFDANNLWRDADTASDFLQALAIPFFSIEEPLQPFAYTELLRLSEKLDTPILLDESLLTSEQLISLPGSSSNWIANVRVSKMGGLLRSMDSIETAKKIGIGVIVGAQVGETSLLTRAGLCIASQAGAQLIAQEGAFGTLLLERDVCSPTLMFGKNGILYPGEHNLGQSCNNFGFGLTIDQVAGGSTA
jgi:L-alanine-DL-glutamate epimerase-like enolase superfamily enzyme